MWVGGLGASEFFWFSEDWVVNKINNQVDPKSNTFSMYLIFWINLMVDFINHPLVMKIEQFGGAHGWRGAQRLWCSHCNSSLVRRICINECYKSTLRLQIRRTVRTVRRICLICSSKSVAQLNLINYHWIVRNGGWVGWPNLVIFGVLTIPENEFLCTPL